MLTHPTVSSQVYPEIYQQYVHQIAELPVGLTWR